MPLKTIKRDTAEALMLEWVLHVKDYRLFLDKNHCVGCQICSLACPKEAIKLGRQSRISGQKARKATVDVDLAKCNFCGICDVLCPYGAIEVTLDGQHALSIIEKESFPQLIRDIQVDTAKCPAGCVECEEACPLDLIGVSTLTGQNSGPKIRVDIQKDHCPCCRICDAECPEGVLSVRKFVQGKIAINPERCPENCQDCLDVCPITGALYHSEDDGKVHVNETFCVYCGACKAVCPVDEAMEIRRTKIAHTPIRSGAWNKALERLTSPADMTKELKTKGSLKARESVRKRIGWKVE